MKKRTVAIVLAVSLVAGSGCLGALLGPANPFAVLQTINSIMELRHLSKDELIARLQAAPGAILEDMVYGKLEGLTRIYDAAKNPAQFYYEGEKMALALVEDVEALGSVTPEQLIEKFGKPAMQLPSALGGDALTAVYPGTGLAFSFEDPKKPIQFLEVFPETTATDYQATIYRAPAIPGAPDLPAAPAVPAVDGMPPTPGAPAVPSATPVSPLPPVGQ